MKADVAEIETIVPAVRLTLTTAEAEMLRAVAQTNVGVPSVVKGAHNMPGWVSERAMQDFLQDMYYALVNAINEVGA